MQNEDQESGLPVRRPVRQGILFVISGPSGAGKDTVLAAYRRFPGAAERCVTATTRAPRAGEISGREYHFLSAQEFDQLRNRGDLLEWARVHSNWYGVPRAAVEERLRAGRDTVLNIDVQGGRTVRALFPDAVTVFLLPPAWEELERRLRERGTDSEAVIRERLVAARTEVRERQHYRYWLFNEEVEAAAAGLAAIVTAERARAERWLAQEPDSRIQGAD